MNTTRWRWAIGVWMVTLVVATGLYAADRDLRLANAAERQDWQTVRTLLKAKVNVNTAQADGATALHWAAHSDNLDIVDQLLRAGADVNAANDHGVTPLSLACENGNAAVAERLVKAGANVNATLPAQGETVLMGAALTGPGGHRQDAPGPRRRHQRQDRQERADRADVGHVPEPRRSCPPAD